MKEVLEQPVALVNVHGACCFRRLSEMFGFQSSDPRFPQVLTLRHLQTSFSPHDIGPFTTATPGVAGIAAEKIIGSHLSRDHTRCEGRIFCLTTFISRLICRNIRVSSLVPVHTLQSRLFVFFIQVSNSYLQRQTHFHSRYVSPSVFTAFIFPVSDTSSLSSLRYLLYRLAFPGAVSAWL